MVTQSFDQNRRKIRSEYAKKAEDYLKQAKDLPDDDPRKIELEAKAQKIQTNLRLFDGITSALYAPNSNGIIGDVARAASPELAYRIGQYFKENKLKNEIDGGNRPEEQSLQHLLAHTILGAAVSYATGNNPITGALSAVGSEAAAPALSKFLFGKDSKELTQDEKDIITNIITLATVSTAYTITDGDVSSAVSAAEVGRVGVENNNEMYLEAQRIYAWEISDGDRDLYFKLIGLQGKLDTMISDLEFFHARYNDMTIINGSASLTGYTIIINNKNGKVYASQHPDFNVSNLANILSSPGGSINFGSVQGGRKTADQIDKAINGRSFGIQGCLGCAWEVQEQQTVR
ncbi:Possible hemagglutinin (DUF638) [Moraxella cuniculi]|uniref:Possible hemagglutinin (DUF638) n=2 Tax=Moraxella cuniculi TaxID=34061 RepID=A0A3S4RL13_9GAMM|nr:Possible hemagglutinin (DUF638) [Moraxella cuniculi]